jgi:hypothetical protein
LENPEVCHCPLRLPVSVLNLEYYCIACL